jgi:hypothetical protein
MNDLALPWHAQCASWHSRLRIFNLARAKPPFVDLKDPLEGNGRSDLESPSGLPSDEGPVWPTPPIEQPRIRRETH